VVPDENAHRGLIPNPANPGQTIDVGVHPLVRPYLDEFPLPNAGNIGSGLGRFVYGFPQQLRQDFGQARYDQNFDRGQLFARYTADDASQVLPMELPQFPRSFLSRNQFVTAEYNRVFSPRLLNTLRAGFSRTRVGQDVEANTTGPVPPFVPGRMVGNIDIGGASRFGPQSSVNVQLVQNVYGVQDNVSYVHGAHTLKFGGSVERYQDNMVNPTFSLGIYAFSDLRAFLENRPLRYVGLAPEGQFDRYWRFTLYGFYIQDDWKVKPGLTFNVGLRYEFSSMPVDIYGRDSSLRNLSDPAPIPGQLYMNPTKKNFSPRFGFAWDPFGGGRTSIRGGYGWFFNTNNQQNLIVTVTNPPATPRLIIAGPLLTFPRPPFERGVGNSIRPVEWNIKNPNVHVWNFNVQQQLPAAVLLTAGYAGSRGIHLWRSTDANLAGHQVLADGTIFYPPGAPRQNPNFSTIELKKSDGNSWYNAFIFELRKRWSRGFNFQSSYTFSRNIDTTQASTFFSDATNGTTSAMPEYPGFSYNKGLADYHSKHNWLVNFAWELPFAKTMSGAGKTLLDGWQLSGIWNLRSGSPLTLFVQRNRSRSQWSPSLAPGIGQDRPSFAPGFTHESAVKGDPSQYFYPAAFALPAAGTLGNAGRGTVIGPNLRTFDLAATKIFKWSRLGEGGAIQFRAEAFNLLNRANFSTPLLTAFAGDRDEEAPLASLGIIRSTVTSSRQIQLSLRISF
jgi:hypothetical protein